MGRVGEYGAVQDQREQGIECIRKSIWYTRGMGTCRNRDDRIVML